MTEMTVRLVIPHEEESSMLMLLDLRGFIQDTATAPSGTSVKIERALCDGVLSDIFEASWISR